MKKLLNYIIAVAAVALSTLLVLTSIDLKVADYFQRPLKSTEESKNVVLVNVDDTAISKIGTFPFNRDVYAKINTTLRDLNSEAIVYDLSFLDKSTLKVEESYVKEELPDSIYNSFVTLSEDVINVIDYYNGENITDEAAEEIKMYFQDVLDSAQNEIQTSVGHVVESMDEVLAGSLSFVGNSYLTLTFNNDNLTYLSDEQKEYLDTFISLEGITVDKDTKTPTYTCVDPAIHEFMIRAKRAGFVNADPDKDGYFRRVNLFVKYNGKYYGQLMLVPLLNHFGNPKIEITNKEIILKNAKISETEIKDLVIPRDENGSVLLKFPKKEFVNYNVISLWNIYRIASYEEQFTAYLGGLADAGYFDYWEGEDIIELFDAIKWMRNELAENGEDIESGLTYETYLDYVNNFYSETRKYFDSNAFALLLDSIDDQEVVYAYEAEYQNLKDYYDVLFESREKLKAKIEDAICIVGTNATSTSDYGINQYEEKYPLPGVHYTIANQILSQDFVDDSPIWISFIIALIFCLGYAFFAKKIKSTGKQIGVGIISVAVLSGILFAIFLISRKFIGFAIPVTSLILSFVATSVAGFLSASHEKKFIQNAFSQCLSKEVVNDIVANPSSFKLGGQRLEMTAMFTDIQKFSGFSELLTASQLVALLNYYLTKMSDIIMDERGTVDKYEGDAIIALVGAPVKMDDHAQRACAAAIKMKKAEVLMNKEISEIAAQEKPEEMDIDLYNAFKIMVQNKRVLFTRIGLNSGEMIAGYMGSENKKNYTMMGNNVNLASRLEGVNKQYSTGGIMISDATRQLIGDRFVVRSLDRVQVVNVNTPIRLYELMDEVSEADEKLLKYVDAWEKTLKIFEDGNYAKALELFKKLSEINPNDKVCKYYISLVEKFFVNGKYPTEQDDFGVSYNASNPEGMNPEWVGTKFEIKGTFRLLQK